MQDSQAFSEVENSEEIPEQNPEEEESEVTHSPGVIDKKLARKQLKRRVIISSDESTDEEEVVTKRITFNDIAKSVKKQRTSEQKKKSYITSEYDEDYRTLSFYVNAKIIGDIKVRPYFNKFNYIWYVHFCKDNDNNMNPEITPTFMKVSGMELPHLIKIIQRQYDEFKSLKQTEIPLKLKKSPFGKITDYRQPEFWDKSHTDYIPSGYIGIRQFITLEGVRSLRLIMPKQNQSSAGCGRSLTLRCGLCKEFLATLKEYQVYFDTKPNGEESD
ncbi:hypothetical protein Fcan01_25172 [Folsomia candida]|uniref:Uncharacterized protein n=1 Tax=Folsomia candida TaxID=158441 RepID=A0A226D5Z0_FOLCA|nr:hypothetical protein Fcan01_25172 [Folsomia candida]